MIPDTSSRKPFQAPVLREEASLVDVTLLSNGRQGPV